PGKGVWYTLGTQQKKALKPALKGKAPGKTNQSIIADTMTALNCYACHERGKVGGPQEEINALFLTTMKEMGDEGRLPPPLDGVGAKITPGYFKTLLDKGVHDRPYMHTRMPGFGEANVAQRPA